MPHWLPSLDGVSNLLERLLLPLGLLFVLRRDHLPGGGVHHVPPRTAILARIPREPHVTHGLKASCTI